MSVSYSTGVSITSLIASHTIFFSFSSAVGVKVNLLTVSNVSSSFTVTSSSTEKLTPSGMTQVIVDAGYPPEAMQVMVISSSSVPASPSIITDSTTEITLMFSICDCPDPTEFSARHQYSPALDTWAGDKDRPWRSGSTLGSLRSSATPLWNH